MGKAIVEAVNNYRSPKKIAEVSHGLGKAMHGKDIESIPEEERMQDREAGN